MRPPGGEADRNVLSVAVVVTDSNAVVAMEPAAAGATLERVPRTSGKEPRDLRVMPARELCRCMSGR